MPTNNTKSKDNTTKSESVKLQPRNINKSTKAVFEDKRKEFLHIMEKLSKKYKIYLLCLGVLFIIGIGFAFYSSNQEKKAIEQKQAIEKYVDSMVGSEKNITSKLKSIKNASIITIGDREYIAEQLNNITNNDILLYNYQYNKVEYLDEYTKSQTNYDTYEQYYDYLCKKYNLNNKSDDVEYKKWYNQCAQKLIDSAKSER